MVSVTELRLRACRARIAQQLAEYREPVTLGGITLRAHQREALARVCTRLDQLNGCLLADDVGRGKTYVALAVARRWTQPLVVVPASLRDSWRTAMQRAGVQHPLLTHESLSVGGGPGFAPDGIIVDESHRFRNPGTRRYAALADIAVHVELLLLSATPVQNSSTDLGAQLALFLGSAALQLSPDSLAEHVVRVESNDAEAGLPGLAPPRWVRPHADDSEILRAILNLPAPPRPLGAGDAGALRTLSLARAWASSRAALAATLARRRRGALALEQCIEAGRMPTLAELRAWTGGDDDSLQLGFASLLVQRHAADDVAAVRDALLAEHDAIIRLARLLRERTDPDIARARVLADIADAHPGERVLAFTEFATTARAYHALLRVRAGVGLLTANGACIASGRITRRELLARFAPAAQGCAEPPLRERVSLLVSTDLLSEGVNLQDASVVVHLDLPWNPARLAQRVGRVRRPHGASHITAYLMAPPADTELLLQVEARLRRKLAVAEQSIGRGITVVPGFTLAGAMAYANAPTGAAAQRTALHARIGRWARDAPRAERRARELLVAAAWSRNAGWLAVLHDDTLLGAMNGDEGDDPALLDRASADAAGCARAVMHGEQQRALKAISDHVQRARLLRDCGVTALASTVARAVERHAAHLLQRAPRHERAHHLASVARLRAGLTHALSLGTERALSRLLAQGVRLPMDEWLSQALNLVQRCNATHDADTGGCDVPRVLILLGPGAHRGPHSRVGAD